MLRPADPEQPILTIDGADATVRGFTITGAGNSVSVVASAPLIDDMVFRGVGDQWWTYTGSGWDGYDDAAPSIRVELFAEPTIQHSLFDGGGEIEIRDSSTARILDNTLINGAAIFLNDASGETVVRGNSITDSGLFSIEITSDTDLLVEGNIIEQSLPGIAIQAARVAGTIRDNVIRGANVGIQIVDGASPEISGNVIDASGTALEVHEGVSPMRHGQRALRRQRHHGRDARGGAARSDRQRPLRRPARLRRVGQSLGSRDRACAATPRAGSSMPAAT